LKKASENGPDSRTPERVDGSFTRPSRSDRLLSSLEAREAQMRDSSKSSRPPQLEQTSGEVHASPAAASVQLKAALRGLPFEQQVQMLSPGPGGDDGGADVHTKAQAGLSGGGGPLPHREAIQKSFGRHDVSNVTAHTGANAESAAASMGAHAYATGNDVVLGEGGKGLHTVAHEAAHVIQQRAGVSLKGGVGQAGDVYEQHADQVADLVVQGKSAEGLLDRYASGAGASESVQRQAVVQREPASVAGAAIAAAAFVASAMPDAAGGLSYTNVMGRYARNTPGPRATRSRTSVVLWLDAIKSLGASFGYFEIDFEHDGSSIPSYRTRLGMARGFSGGMFGSGASCTFQATPRGNGTEEQVEILIAFSGHVDPSGPGFASYDGTFSIKADGSMTLNECRVTRGSANVNRSAWFRVGWTMPDNEPRRR